MISGENISRWCVCYTAPKSEHKLVRCLNAAGCVVFCPMQISFKKWNGQTKEMHEPLFRNCVFVEYREDIVLLAASFHASLLTDDKGEVLSIYADKAELTLKFVQLLT